MRFACALSNLYCTAACAVIKSKQSIIGTERVHLRNGSAARLNYYHFGRKKGAAMTGQPIGKFYDNLNISFPIGSFLCQALKISFEQCLRSFPSHSHSKNSWELHYIAYGKGRITLNHESHDISANSFFITGPHVEHSQFSDPLDPVAEYCVYLTFDPSFSRLKHQENPDFLASFINTYAFIGRDSQDIHLLMQNLFYELDHKNTGFMTQVITLLTQLLIKSVRNSKGEKQPVSLFEPSTPMDRNYLIIEECFLYEYQDLTLEKLAVRLGLSSRQTERLLRKHYDKTFLQKKQESKMAAAAVLLKNPKCRITDAAMALGYSSIEHFSYAFCRYYGVSAREWRKNVTVQPYG